MLRRVVRLWVASRVRWLLLRRRLDEVVELCRALLQQHPDEPLLYYYQGRAYFAQKNHLSAYWSLKNADRAASAAGRSLPAAMYYFLGVSAYQLGRHEQSLEWLERFRRQVGRVERHLMPSVSLARACYYVGYTHLRQGDLAAAAAAFEELLEAGGPEDTTVVVDLATIYCSDEVGRYRDAVRILEEALARFPRELELFKGLSYAHSLLDEAQRSLMYALKALHLCPEDRWTHQQLAYLYAQKDVQNYSEAFRELDLLLEEDPEDHWAQEFRRHLHSSRGARRKLPTYLRLVDRLD